MRQSPSQPNLSLRIGSSNSKPSSGWRRTEDDNDMDLGFWENASDSLSSTAKPDDFSGLSLYNPRVSEPSNTTVQEVLSSWGAKFFQGKDYDSDSESSSSVKNYSTLKRKSSVLGEDSDHATAERKLSRSGEPDDVDSDFTDINAFIRILKDGARR